MAVIAWCQPSQQEAAQRIRGFTLADASVRFHPVVALKLDIKPIDACRERHVIPPGSIVTDQNAREVAGTVIKAQVYTSPDLSNQHRNTKRMRKCVVRTCNGWRSAHQT